MPAAYTITVGTASAVDAQYLRVTLPLVGAWTADLISVSATSASTITGAPVAIGFGGLSLTGTILRGGNWRSSLYARVIGGAGGLAKTVAPQGYSGITAQMLLTTLLAAGGEKLSTTAQIPGTTFSTWIQQAEPVADAISRVADYLALNWRVLPDGTVWFGTETWPAASLTQPVLLDSYPERGELFVGITQPELLPGQDTSGVAEFLGQGGHVSDVDYDMRGDGKYRMRVFLAD